MLPRQIRNRVFETYIVTINLLMCFVLPPLLSTKISAFLYDSHISLWRSLSLSLPPKKKVFHRKVSPEKINEISGDVCHSRFEHEIPWRLKTLTRLDVTTFAKWFLLYISLQVIIFLSDLIYFLFLQHKFG